MLDRSYAGARAHLLSIRDPEHRADALMLCERLTGMRLLARATVTADGRPLVGPVDGIFYRGAFHFGSSPESVRFRHIRDRPQVSATHLPGEELSPSPFPSPPATPGLRASTMSRSPHRRGARKRRGAFSPAWWDDSLPGLRRFYVKDPWGNRLELLA